MMNALQQAEEMGVHPRWAAIARLRYLKPLIAQAENALAKMMDLIEAGKGTEDINRVYLAYVSQANIDNLQAKLRRYQFEAQQLQDFLDGKKVKEKREFSPEELHIAKNTPIASLLGQTPKGPSMMVKCPFHEDKTASASVKTNRLHCFSGCRPKNGDKSWSPITLLMERDGMSFVDAVKYLLGGHP